MKNDEDILVSILIACYNGEKYINKCIRSCLEQTYKNIEIVIVNDGSKDDSQKIIEWWIQKDNRIRLINKPNQGLGATRNILIEEARGEYFTFVDVDDWLNPNSIEVFVNEIKKDNYDIVVGRTNFAYDTTFFNRIPFFVSWLVTKRMTNFQYVKSNICTPWASLIKTEFFKSLKIYFIEGKIFEDFGVMTYVYIKAKKFQTIKDIVYNYHRYKKQSNKSKNLSSFESYCFKKTNDVFWQINQLMYYLSKDNLLETKKQKRFVNGCLFQILVSNIFLSSNLTKNMYYRYLINYDLVKTISLHGLYFRYSKTFWKSLAFFYIYFKNFRVLNHIKKNKRWPFYINGSLKEKNGYSLMNSQQIKIRPSRWRIYDLSLDEILNRNIDEDSRNTNIALAIDDWDEERVKRAISIMNFSNAVPFVIIRTSKLTPVDINYLQGETLGIIIDLRIIDIDYGEKIIRVLKDTERERMIFLIADKKDEEKIYYKSLTNGVFWNE